jgi:hypothetical protein
MTEREEIRDLRERNDRLDSGLTHTFQKLCCKERECLELREANANLRVERDATDELLGAAMDEALQARNP